MSQFDADNIVEQVASRVQAAMEMQADAGVETIRQLIGIPYPPAGPTGEMPMSLLQESSGYPHRRKGLLQDGVSADTKRTGDAIETTYSSERVEGDPDVPRVLEYGLGMKGPRPYMHTSAARIGPRTRAAVADSLKQGGFAE